MDGFALFERINAERRYFKELHRADLADNSDHYPFAVRGVPCIFFMNEDGDAFKYYHTVYDTYENTIFDSYEPIFEFLVEFIENHQYDK
jgi:Zn-dependent M28 family amino/carboxypeptidase